MFSVTLLIFVCLLQGSMEMLDPEDRSGATSALRDLPNVKAVSCYELTLADTTSSSSHHTCLKITFSEGGEQGKGLTEYAVLDEDSREGVDPDFYDVEQGHILSGPLYSTDPNKKGLQEIQHSRVSMTHTHGRDNKGNENVQVVISGSKGTDELFQMTVDLSTGQAHPDELSSKADYFGNDDVEQVQSAPMTDGVRQALLDQFNMDRQLGMPALLNLKIQFVIDGHFASKFGYKALTRVAGVYNHMKTYFYHASKVHGVRFALSRFPTQTATDDNGNNMNIIITKESRDTFGKLASEKVEKGEWPVADTYILLSSKNDGGLYGRANLGWYYGHGVCSCDIAKRVSINWYETNANFEDDLLTALTVVHETGHNLGMQHDFVYENKKKITRKDSTKKACTGIGGFMDYVFAPYKMEILPKKWSGCSEDDLKVVYQLNKNVDGVYCLEKETAETKINSGDDVCVNLKLTTPKKFAWEMHWSYGNCCSKADQYKSDKTYDIKCCQPPGYYELICKDTSLDGWTHFDSKLENGHSSGYIQMGSKEEKLCADFRGDWKKKDAARKTMIVDHVTGEVCKDCVCIDIKVSTKMYASDYQWTFGSCSGGGVGTAGYQDNQDYQVRCCQPPGNYQLVCRNDMSDGWNGGFIQIGPDGGGGGKLCGQDVSSQDGTFLYEQTVHHPSGKLSTSNL